MVWLIALLCLGVVGATGYHQGPIRAAFSLFGLLFGALLAGPLSPLTKHLLPIFGLAHPIWQIFVPQAIAFIMVLIIFKIAGQVVHSKLSLHFKYKADEKRLISWHRLYARLGFCVGLLNGAIYFFLLMIPIYVGGYFTTEASAGPGDPAGAKFLTQTRAELHNQHLDRALAAYDPTPVQVYQAADIIDLVLHNPLLEDRLSHYPPFLTLGERPQFKDLANDVTLQQMIQSQAKASDILNYPKVQAIVTNATLTQEIYGTLSTDLSDLRDYLTTGKSPKYESETILGIWTIDPAATLAGERKRHALTPVKTMALREELFPIIANLTLTATTDNQLILKKENPTTADFTAVATGTWKKDGEYQVTLPGSKPETTEIKIEGDDVLLLPKDGYVLVFNKET
ncbi:MAG TPA: hypothetical protein VFC44_18510 [Candidatus Saccharimonadales bacterium]|nr:hypothetical protein [Candidatus Saccharimonadales bacterium]